MTGGARDRRDGYDHSNIIRDFRRKDKKKKKVDPCLALPVAPTGLLIDWVDKGQRHAPWWADCYWAEVTEDVDGFLLRTPVRRYLIQFQRRSPAAVVDDDVRRIYVPAHDNDDNSDVHKMVHIHNRDWDFRFRVRAETGLLLPGDRSDWSDWSAWSNPNDPPPKPTDVTIKRASHAVRLSWDAPNDPADSDIMDRRIRYFIAELYSTTDKDVRDYGTLYKRAQHLHKKMHRFHVDTDGDDRTWYYGRVRSVSDDDVKSNRVPATKAGNSAEGTTPSLARPLFHRVIREFTIQGPLQAKTYVVPAHVDDDYIVRRVVVAAHKAGSGGATHVDIKVNGGGTAGSGYIFGDSDAHDVAMAAGDRTASSRDVQNGILETGDHLRVVVRSVPATPPENATVSVVADRYWAPDDAAEEASLADSGGGGGE